MGRMPSGRLCNARDAICLMVPDVVIDKAIRDDAVDFISKPLLPDCAGRAEEGI